MFDSKNQPIIAVADYMTLPRDVLLARKDSGSWTADVVLSRVLEPNHYLALTYSNDGAVIAYSAPEGEKMKVYAARESSGWAKELVDEIPVTEATGIIQIIRTLSNNGKVGIFYRCYYFESEIEELRLAYEEGFFPADDDDSEDDTNDDDDIDDDSDDDNDSEDDGDKNGCGCSMR